MPKDSILLVDDEPVVLAVLAEQLAPFESAHEIVALPSGGAALDWLDGHQRSGGLLALTIADQVMPGTTGVELLEAVHRSFPVSAKILVTGHGSLDVVARALNNAGLDRYISKPWEEADLLITVEALLEQYRRRRDYERQIAELQQKLTTLQTRNQELDARLRHRHPSSEGGQ